MRKRRLFYKLSRSIRSVGKKADFAVWRGGHLRNRGCHGSCTIEGGSLTNFHPDEVGGLVGIQRILPAFRGPEIACETGNECITLNGNIEIESFVIAKQEGGGFAASAIERNIFHLEPQVSPGAVHFDVADDAGGISPVTDRPGEDSHIQLFDPFSDPLYGVRGAHKPDTKLTK